MKKLVLTVLMFAAGVVHAGENICLTATGSYTAPTCTGGGMQVSVNGVTGVQLPNDTYITSVDNAGTGTNSLLKSSTDDDTYLNCDAGELIKLSEAGTAKLTIDPTAAGDADDVDVILGKTATTAPVFTIRGQTADGDDDGILYLASGGAAATSRGGYIQIQSNETSGAADLKVIAGDSSGAHLYLDAGNASGDIYIEPGGSTLRWTFGSAGDLTQNATNGGNIVMSKASTGFRYGTKHADISAASVLYASLASNTHEQLHRGSDDANGPGLWFYKSRATDGSADTIIQNGDEVGQIYFAAADGAAYGRVAQIVAIVNGAPGSGDTPGALQFQLSPDGSSTPATAMQLSNNKNASFAGEITSSATGSLGWSVVDGADNTACTAQCTSAAVFGLNLAAGATDPVMVGPADATADICLCAGAS